MSPLWLYPTARTFGAGKRDPIPEQARRVLEDFFTASTTAGWSTTSTASWAGHPDSTLTDEQGVRLAEHLQEVRRLDPHGVPTAGADSEVDGPFKDGERVCRGDDSSTLCRNAGRYEVVPRVQRAPREVDTLIGSGRGPPLAEGPLVHVQTGQGVLFGVFPVPHPQLAFAVPGTIPRCEVAVPPSDDWELLRTFSNVLRKGTRVAQQALYRGGSVLGQRREPVAELTEVSGPCHRCLAGPRASGHRAPGALVAPGRSSVPRGQTSATAR